MGKALKYNRHVLAIEPLSRTAAPVLNCMVHVALARLKATHASEITASIRHNRLCLFSFVRWVEYITELLCIDPLEKQLGIETKEMSDYDLKYFRSKFRLFIFYLLLKYVVG